MEELSIRPYAPTLLIKPASADCNLDCSYCFYHRPEDPYQQATRRRMTPATSEVLVRNQFEAAAGRPLSFMFQGGEPLLAGYEFFAHFVQLTHRLRLPRQSVSLAVQTNGLRMDDRLARLFRENDFLIGVSLDGAADLHNTYRRNRGGRGSHSQVLRGLRILQRHSVAYNILAVVNAATAAHPEEVYRYLKDEVGAGYIQFIPCVEMRNSQLIPESISSESYAQFLVALFEAWMQDGYGTVSIQLFDHVTNFLYNGQTNLCILEPACARALVIEYNGDVYPCDFYVSSDQLLGNIHIHSMAELMAAPPRVLLEKEKGQLPEECPTCPYLPLCYGGCPKYRRINAQSGKGYHYYFCQAHKAVFERLLPVASDFVARLLWNEATQVERILLFGMAQMGQTPDGVTLPALQARLTEFGEVISPTQQYAALNALINRRVLTRPSSDHYVFRTNVLPVWIERTHQGGQE